MVETIYVEESKDFGWDKKQQSLIDRPLEHMAGTWEALCVKGGDCQISGVFIIRSRKALKTQLAL